MTSDNSKSEINLLYRQMGLTDEEIRNAERGSSLQAHYEGQLGADR